jgi:hypothetical protein
VYLINCSKKGTSNTSPSLLTNEGRPFPENDIGVFTKKFLEMYKFFLSKKNNFLRLNIRIFTPQENYFSFTLCRVEYLLNAYSTFPINLKLAHSFIFFLYIVQIYAIYNS